MSNQEVLEAQIIASAQRVDTKPIEYSRQLKRILAINPTLTCYELAARLGKSTKWIKERLSLNKIINPLIQDLIDGGVIHLTNAYALARLPEDEQTLWVNKARNMRANDFVPQINRRIQELQSKPRLGKFDQRVKGLMGHGFTMDEMKQALHNAYVRTAPRLRPNITKDHIIDAMKRCAVQLANVHPCLSVARSKRCNNTSDMKPGLLNNIQRWYCEDCYLNWGYIDYGKVNTFTIPKSVATPVDEFVEKYRKLDSRESYNRTLGENFVDDRPQCTICDRRLNERQMVKAKATKRGNLVCGPCGRHDDRVLSYALSAARKTVNLGRPKLKEEPESIITEAPQNWDIVMIDGRQAFLRFDGVKVMNWGGYWRVVTTNDLRIGNQSATHLEAINLADKNIPMGELL